MFRTIVSKIARDKDYPSRTFTLDVLGRIRDGAFYDHLPYGFHVERNDAGEYIPLRDRRPSVKHNICRIAVDDSVSLLFSEGHFPTPLTSDPKASANILQLAKDCRLNETMLDAATIGSVGSVAILMRVLPQDDGKFRAFFETHETGFLTPVFKDNAPDTLAKMVEKYKVSGEELEARGYPVSKSDRGDTFWFSREWDDSAETWFTPWKIGDDEKPGFEPVVDQERTIKHDLGFVPWVWVRNLPGKLRLLDGRESGSVAPSYSDIDGACTFVAAVDTMIEIDYQLSQGGRGLKYAMDPLLMVREPPSANREFVKSPANALVVDKDGDAKLLEISGASFGVVLEWVRALRELALETIHGNRADASKLSTAQSGRAMELMNQALIWLADKLRVNYGEFAYRRLLEMAVAAHAKFPLLVNGEELPAIDPATQIALNWPTWFEPTNRDLQEQAQTIKTLRDAKAISRKTAVANIAFAYDIESVDDELAQIAADDKADIALVPDPENVAEQIRVTE